MHQNWICPNCKSYNPQKRDHCWNCQTNRSASERVTPVDPSKGFKSIRHTLQRHWRLGIAIGLILVVFGHILTQYLVDRNNYKTGHAAFQQVQCQTAIMHYTKLMEDWRLVNLGGFTTLAKQELAECIPFQKADDLILSGDYGAALMAHYHFIHDFKQSNLVPHSNQRIRLLFTSIASQDLTSLDSCSHIDAFLDQYLVPNVEMVLPPLLFSCGQLYADSGKEKDAFEFHMRLLIEYPSHELATDTESALLSNEVSCDELDSIEALASFTNRSGFLGSLYYHCGKSFYVDGKYQQAFQYHSKLLNEFPNHPLADSTEEIFYNAPEYCDYIETLDGTVLAERPSFLPTFYFTCSQAYEVDRAYEKAVEMYAVLISRYPNHDLADAAEESLTSNLEYCNDIDTLEESILKERPGMKPKLYRQCGDYHLGNQDYDQAITLFEHFLAEYPNHKRASEVEISLAKAIVDRSKQGDSGEILRPEPSGTTSQRESTVIIQNDSPLEIRIVFSGPQTRIEVLEACQNCETYQWVGPVFCPEKGPIGKYSLLPGAYDVVVEASSDSGVIPFTGSWELIRGDEYFNCFFIVEKFFPE